MNEHEQKELENAFSVLASGGGADKVEISVVCTRTDELDETAKDVRKFIRTIRRELDDAEFSMNVVINPHGIDHGNKQVEKKIGFKIVVDDETAENKHGA